MSSAWRWWWIMPCMKRTSAAVCADRSTSVSSSSLSSRAGSPGAPGWTTLGADVTSASGSSDLLAYMAPSPIASSATAVSATMSKRAQVSLRNILAPLYVVAFDALGCSPPLAS